MYYVEKCEIFSHRWYRLCQKVTLCVHSTLSVPSSTSWLHMSVCRKRMWLQFPVPACCDEMGCVCVTGPVPWCVPELSLTLHWFVWKYCLFTQQAKRPHPLAHQHSPAGRPTCSFLWLCVRFMWFFFLDSFFFFFYQLMCMAKRRWRQDCATATWDHQVYVCVCEWRGCRFNVLEF